MRSTQTLTKKVTHWMHLPKAPKEEYKDDKLDVQEYCQECPYFDAVMVPGYCNMATGWDTVIRCTRAEKCAWVVEEALRLKEEEK